MPDPVTPITANKAVDSAGKDEITAASKYPPLTAWSTTDKAAVSGVASGTGTALSGVAERGGPGVYGKSSGHAGLFDGAVQVNGNLTCTGDVFLSGADCAEQFDLADAAVEAGTLMVMNDDGALRACDTAYDRRVVGVVAGAGDYRPGIVLDGRPLRDSRVAISLMGKAYCKVDAAAAPVEIGDLLTSSDTPGHAMKASDASQAFGSVVGKALQPLKSGRGLIPILVTLQ
jgi:hypothetical protein